jgi:hypothetical protein
MFRSTVISSTKNNQITAATPAILLKTGFWALILRFTFGQARKMYAELSRKDGKEDVNERYLGAISTSLRLTPRLYSVV